MDGYGRFSLWEEKPSDLFQLALIWGGYAAIGISFLSKKKKSKALLLPGVAAVGIGLLGQIASSRKRRSSNDCQREGTCNRCSEKARGPASRTRRSYTLAPDRS